MNPFFSIIIPTFNRAQMLSKAIQSVLGQTYTKWELLIIDDGSTDNTKEIVESFNDNRIVYYWQENQERSAARNKGIELSKGTYICFLDSDDYYLDNHLSIFYDLLKNKTDIACYYSDLCFENKKGEIINHKHSEEFNGDLAFILRTTIHSQQTCIHRKILEKHRFNSSFKVGEDIELWMRIFDKYPVFHIKKHTVVVVQHNNRTIDRLNTDAYKSIIPLYKHIFTKTNPGSKIPISHQRFLYSSVYFGIAKSCIFNNRKWEAIFFLLKAICKKPFIKYVKYRILLILKLLFIPNYCDIFINEEMR